MQRVDPITVQGNLTVTGRYKPGIDPAQDILQRDLQPYVIPLTAFVVHDAPQTKLPGTPATDDLGLVGTTFGTDAIHVSAGDLGAAGATTRRMRVKWALPPEYVAGQTVVIRISAGMDTTAADTSCTVDVEAHKSDDEQGVGADLCADAAQSMNSTTFADIDFEITPTTLGPGDELDIRISIVCTDAATGPEVEPVIGKVTLLCDTKG